MIEDLSLRNGDKSIEFSDCSDPGLVSALIEMENYDNRIGWYLDTEEAIKVRDWLSAVIERATGEAGEKAALEARIAELERPIDMLLFCPRCGAQHVDAPQPAKDWDNPPHRSHECQSCNHVWRPADVATNGVTTIQTKGQRDGDPAPQDDLAWLEEQLEVERGSLYVNTGYINGIDCALQFVREARSERKQQPKRQE